MQVLYTTVDSNCSVHAEDVRGTFWVTLEDNENQRRLVEVFSTPDSLYVNWPSAIREEAACVALDEVRRILDEMAAEIVECRRVGELLEAMPGLTGWVKVGHWLSVSTGGQHGCPWDYQFMVAEERRPVAAVVRATLGGE